MIAVVTTTTTAIPPPKVIRFLNCIDLERVEKLLEDHNLVEVMFYGYDEKESKITDKNGKIIAEKKEMVKTEGFGARITSAKNVVQFSDRSNIKLLSDKTVEELR